MTDIQRLDPSQPFDTQVGAMDVTIPKPRSGSYFPRLAAQM